MKIKNYTTSVPVDRTAAMIEKALVEIGASSIMKNYSDGALVGISFKVSIPESGQYSFKVPARISEAEPHVRQIPNYRRRPDEWIKQQSARVAWRIVHDWVVSNCAMIKLGQAVAMQVFMPYVVDKHNITLYTRLTSDKGSMRPKLLGEP